MVRLSVRVRAQMRVRVRVRPTELVIRSARYPKLRDLTCITTLPTWSESVVSGKGQG